MENRRKKYISRQLEKCGQMMLWLTTDGHLKVKRYGKLVFVFQDTDEGWREADSFLFGFKMGQKGFKSTNSPAR